MKRDMDLARSILLKIEDSPVPYHGDWIDLKFDGHSPEVVNYHVMLLAQAGLIEADTRELGGDEPTQWDATVLTWRGHEFLDAARNNNIWSKAKEIVAKTGSSAFSVLLQILLDLGKTEAMKYLPK